MSPGYLAFSEPDRWRPFPLSWFMFLAVGDAIGDAKGEANGDARGDATGDGTILLGLRGPCWLFGVAGLVGRSLEEMTLFLRVRMVPWFQVVSRGCAEKTVLLRFRLAFGG